MGIKRVAFLVWFLQPLMATMCAQIPEAGPTVQIVRDGAKLNVALKMDRQEYFPGELAELTIKLENPTNETLEIFKPFVRETFRIATREKGNALAKHLGVEYGPLSEDGLDLNAARLDIVPPSQPTVKIQPGERLTKKLHSYDRELAEYSYVIEPNGATPIWAGDFRAIYWSGKVDFRVVMPIFEGIIKIDLPEWEVPRIGLDVGKRVQQKAYAFVLAHEGKHYLCLEHVPFSGRVGPIRTDAEGRLISYEFGFGRYSRIAESGTPIESLKGESDTAGNLTLTWGKTGEHRLFLRQEEWRIRDHNLPR